MWITIYKALESFLVFKLVLSYTPGRKGGERREGLHPSGCLATSNETFRTISE